MRHFSSRQGCRGIARRRSTHAGHKQRYAAQANPEDLRSLGGKGHISPPYLLMASRKARLLFVSESLSRRNSMLSTTFIGWRTFLSIHIRLRYDFSTSSSSFRVPDLLM